MTHTGIDQEHLARAIELAERGTGQVHPNPRVGAVVVKDDVILGEGWHSEYGGPHAEVNALADCGDADIRGATMFVSLEPCCHQGKTPPCTDAIVAAGIARVVVASDDPSEKAAGRGLGILRDEGVDVEVAGGELATRARLLNQAFRKHARTGRPWILFKSAMTLDGKVATRAGDSKWISNESSRMRAHHWRASVDAVAVGIGTALADDPQLTARVEGVHAPAPARRVRLHGPAAAGLPARHQRARDPADGGRLARGAAHAPSTALELAGAEVVVATGENEPARVRCALDQLGELGVSLDPAGGRPAPGGRVLRRRRDRRGAAVHRAAGARRPLGPRPARGRGRRADLRGAARADAGLRAGRRATCCSGPAEGVVARVHRPGRRPRDGRVGRRDLRRRAPEHREPASRPSCARATRSPSTACA